MADLDIAIAPYGGSYLYDLCGAHFGGFHNGYLYDFHSETIYVALGADHIGSPYEYNLRLYKSTDFGETWTYETLESSNNTTYRAGGAQIWQDPDGYIYVVATAGSMNSPWGTQAKIFHNRLGTWSTVGLTLHDSPTPGDGDPFYGAQDSYIWPHGDGTWDIWVVGSMRYTTDPGYTVFHVDAIRWNTATGATPKESITASTWSSYILRGHFGGAAPNPTVGPEYGMPIICCEAVGASGQGSRVVTARRKSDGTWIDMGCLEGDPANKYAAAPQIHVRRWPDTAGCLVEIWYYTYSLTATYGYVSASHTLNEVEGWTEAPLTRLTRYDSTSYGASIVFSEKYPGMSYTGDTNLIYPSYSSGNKIFWQYPPLGTRLNYSTLVDLGSVQCGGIGRMYLPGPDGKQWFPQQRFKAGFAFPYIRNQSGQKSVYFFKKEGTLFYDADPVTLFVIEEAVNQITIGFPVTLDGEVDAVPEDGSGTLVHTQNNYSGEFVYQKVKIVNLLTEMYNLTLTYSCSVGTPHLALGTLVDTQTDAVEYTYSSNVLFVEDMDVLDEAYVWLRWTPPVDFKTVPVGEVQHTLLRELEIPV